MLEASDVVDGGDIWAARTFRMGEAGKSTLYRHEVRRARDRRRRRGGDSDRKKELVRSHACFFGADRSYHDARHRFVHML